MNLRVMLTEDQVNVAVKAFLEGRGWVNVKALSGNQKGVDVAGSHPRAPHHVHVESKGGTSGRASSARFGKCFDTAAVCVHVAEAAFTALRFRERSSANTVLIALPDDNAHLSRIRPVEGTLRSLNIGLLAVSPDGVRVVYGLVEPELHL